MGGRRWWILVALIVAVLPLAVDLPLVVVAIPRWSATLATTPARAAQAAAVVLLAGALLLPVGVLVGGRVGARTSLAAGLMLCLAGAGGEVAAHSILTVALARLLVAAGAAAALPAALRVLWTVFEPAEQARAVVVWAGITGLAVVCAPLLAGYLLDHVGWPVLFGWQPPAFAAGLVAAGLRVPGIPAGAARGWGGSRELAAPVMIFLLAGSTVALSVRLQAGEHHHPAVLAGSAVAIVLSALAVAVRAVAPLVGRFGRHALTSTGLGVSALVLAGLASTSRPAGLVLLVPLGAAAALVLGAAPGGSPLLRTACGGLGVAVLGSAPPSSALAGGAVLAAGASAVGLGLARLGARRAALPPP